MMIEMIMVAIGITTMTLIKTIEAIADKNYRTNK